MKPLLKMTIPGNPITKKNSRPIYRNSATGTPFVGKLKKLQEREDATYIIMLSQKPSGFRKITTPVHLVARFYRENKHKCDLSNLLELPQDALVAAQIIEDDSLIESVDRSRKFYDKLNPRIEIEIYPYIE